MGSPGASALDVAETADHAANHAMRWWILAVLGVAQLMVILDNTVVNIALLTAQHALGFSNADRQWVVTAYSLAFGSLLLLGGRIGDLFGRKRTLIIGLAGFAGASAIGGASVNFPMLVTARTVQGAFGALLAPSVLALLTTTFTDFRERGKAFAIYGGIAGAGGALGLLLGGILTSYASWRWTLYINLVFAAVATPGPVLARTTRPPTAIRWTFPGFSWSLAACSAWSTASLTPRPPPGATPSPLVSWLGAILLAGFALLELRVPHPLLPPRVIQNRTRGGSMLAMLFASMGLFVLPVPHLLPARDTQVQPSQDRHRLLPMIAALAGWRRFQPGAPAPLGPKVIVPPGCS